MIVSTATRPVTQATEVPSWDWRRDLTSLDAALADVERQCAWDWRRDLAELEDRLDQLAQKHGIISPELRAGLV
jgi:hypothetical protein